ncbi:MAG: hypothetical protein PUA84_08580 [Oscillospiraceae bacterium]|nr:hypothetical protein [Oscillospiraceae bacterium]
MKLSEKMSYLKGLADGLKIDITTNEGRILSEMMEVLETAVMYIDDLQNQVDELTELCEDLDSDLGDVEEFLLDEDEELDFDDEDDEDYDFDEEEDLYETVCPTCENTIVLADSILDEGSMKCPCCGELLEFDFDDISIEDFEESDQEDEE